MLGVAAVFESVVSPNGLYTLDVDNVEDVYSDCSRRCHREGKGGEETKIRKIQIFGEIRELHLLARRNTHALEHPRACFACFACFAGARRKSGGDGRRRRRIMRSGDIGDSLTGDGGGGDMLLSIG